MATVTPTVNRYAAKRLVMITWADLATGDTINEIDLGFQGIPAAIASVQISGTFGSATVTLTASNDDSTYVTLADTGGTDISATSAASFEISTAMRYLKPTISGGSSDAVDVNLAVWMLEEGG